MASFTDFGRDIWGMRAEALLILIVIGLVVLGFQSLPRYPHYGKGNTDAYMALYERCLAAVPDGPASTHYNDWAEVVEECKSLAYEQTKVCVKHCEG